jgi:hypothetical protein
LESSSAISRLEGGSSSNGINTTLYNVIILLN